MKLELAVYDQLWLFLYSCILGLCLAALYDVFRIARIAIKTNAIILFLEDVLYFTICAIATSAFLIIQNQGKIRWFPIFGEFVGFIIYYFTIGKLVMKISTIIINAIKSLFKLLFKVFISPFIYIYRLFYKLLKPHIQNLKNKNKLLKNKIKFNLKKQQLIVYNLYNKKSKNKKTSKTINKRNVINEKDISEKKRKKI